MSLRYITVQIREADEWEKVLKAGGKYYFTRFVRIQSLDSANADL